ncbi:Cys-tRNA(Pro) deacylase [Desulfomarina sp.]
MTPAINQVKKGKINFKIHKYTHSPVTRSFGEEAAEKLGVSPHQVFKTLVVCLDKNQLGVAVLPVSSRLSLKKTAKAAKRKKCTMADKLLVEKTTGYVVGGISPLGLKKKLPAFIDITAREFDTIYVSAGRRGLEIELAPGDLALLTEADFALLRE